jgi:Fe-S oxidoreductase
MSHLMKALLHIHPNRSFPKFARPFTPDRRLARDARRRRGERRTSPPVEAPKVFLWADTFNNYFHPATLRAAHKVLTEAGFRITVPNRHLCCGRPLYDFGMLDLARRQLRQILAALRPEIEAGLPVVGLEPSCVAVFRDELVNLFPGDEAARRLSAQTFTLAEFLVREGFEPPRQNGEVIVQGHCHHHSVMGMDADRTLLSRLGVDFKILDAGCCGMAGAFGFEAEHYEVSLAVAGQALLPAVRAAGPEVLILADGFSCREQIGQLTGRGARHLAEVVVAAPGVLS